MAQQLFAVQVGRLLCRLSRSMQLGSLWLRVAAGVVDNRWGRATSWSASLRPKEVVRVVLVALAKASTCTGHAILNSVLSIGLVVDMGQGSYFDSAVQRLDGVTNMIYNLGITSPDENRIDYA